MANLPSVLSKMLTNETDFDSNVTESLLQKLGKNINYLIDKIAIMTTGTTVGVGGLAVSNSSGTYALPSVGPQYGIPNLSVTITTSGRAVCVGLVPTPTFAGKIKLTNLLSGTATNNDFNSYVIIQKNGIDFAKNELYTEIPEISSGSILDSNFSISYPGSSIHAVDISTAGSAGTYTYSIVGQMTKPGGSAANPNMIFSNLTLVAYEL